MSDRDLFAAVAQKTGEDSHEIRRRGFVLTGPDDADLDPECLLDVLLVDLPEMGTVDWDAPGAVLQEHAEGPAQEEEGQGGRRGQGRREEAGGPSGVTCC